MKRPLHKHKRDNEMPPLKLQYEAGYNAFTNSKQWTKRLDNETVIVTSCPYKPDSMQAKEWHRGYNEAYFQNLERLNATEKRG